MTCQGNLVRAQPELELDSFTLQNPGLHLSESVDEECSGDVFSKRQDLSFLVFVF